MLLPGGVGAKARSCPPERKVFWLSSEVATYEGCRYSLPCGSRDWKQKSCVNTLQKRPGPVEFGRQGARCQQQGLMKGWDSVPALSSC